MMSVIDFPALAVAILIAAGVTAALLFAFRDVERDKRRSWLAAGGLFVALLALGALDVFIGPEWETKFSTVIIGAALCVLSALGMVRGTRRIHLRYRIPLVFVIAFVMLMAGLLLGASYVSRSLPF